jgi:hypothetical protein
MMYTVLVSLLILLTAQAQTQNDLDAAGTKKKHCNVISSPTDVSLNDQRLLDDAYLGRCVHRTMHPSDDVSLADVSRPFGTN